MYIQHEQIRSGADIQELIDSAGELSLIHI